MEDVKKVIREGAAAYQKEDAAGNLDEEAKLDCLGNMLELVEQLPGFNLEEEKAASLAVKLLLGEMLPENVKFSGKPSKAAVKTLERLLEYYRDLDENAKRASRNQTVNALREALQFVPYLREYAEFRRQEDPANKPETAVAKQLMSGELLPSTLADSLRESEGLRIRPESNRKGNVVVEQGSKPDANRAGDESVSIAAIRTVVEELLTDFGKSLQDELDRRDRRHGDRVKELIDNARSEFVHHIEQLRDDVLQQRPKLPEDNSKSKPSSNGSKPDKPKRRKKKDKDAWRLDKDFLKAVNVMVAAVRGGGDRGELMKELTKAHDSYDRDQILEAVAHTYEEVKA